MIERNKNIDLLRVISCVMVIVLHISATYVNQNINNPNQWFTVGNFIDSFMRVCVPIFLLISGAFNIGNKLNKDYVYFYKKTLKAIVLPTFIWGFFYCTYITVVSALEGYSPTPISIVSTYFRIFSGKPYYHMWYMYMLVGLYLVTPSICRIIDKIKVNQLFIISFLFIGVGIISNLFVNFVWPLEFINYIGYYILGYCLKHHCNQDNRGGAYLWFYLLSSFSIFLITEVIVRFNIYNKTLYFYSYLSPFVIVAAISIFVYFLRHKEFNINVNRIQPHTFNIYMIHAGIYNTISIFLNKLDRWQNPIWFIPFLTILVLILSFGMSVLINRAIVSLKVKFVRERY